MPFAAARVAGHPLWHVALVFGVPAVLLGVLLGTDRWVRSARVHPSGLGVVVALSSAGAAAVHAAVCPEHFREAVEFGVFFLFASSAQAASALWLFVRPTRRLYTWCAIGNAAVIALWLVSRTTGLPIGPTPWQPEAIGGADKLAVFLELTVVCGAGWILHHAPAQRETRAPQPRQASDPARWFGLPQRAPR